MKRKEQEQRFVSASTTPDAKEIAAKFQRLKEEKNNRVQKYPAKRQKPADDIASTVAGHYNNRDDVGVQMRKESPIFNLKQFNNWIKSVLIKRYVKQGGTVLDLCCGKGGDLQKFQQNKVKTYYGADIADKSVKDAVQRYNQTAGSNKQFTFAANFISGDCTKKPLSSVIPANVTFDSVSCQFALHYSFETEQQARQLMLNATEKLKSGGYFVCTVPDAYVLVKKLRSVESLTIQNKIVKACFKTKKFTEVFGNQYSFELLDAIDDCPEYLVPCKDFVALAKEYGLSVVEEKNFHEFFETWSEHDDFKFLTDRVYKLREGNMTADEWEAIYLYRAFVFRKDGQADQQDAYNPSQNFFKLVDPLKDIKYL
ncbi:mRNA (guanine-N7-)-methyltransferase [Acrasis kona]|uniref:mRNA cap guanine-N(7) methyltransferase n=1 Tax=Acrasis kona TaxID=1008807 RepID=A0AAW2Z609_9EUKA